KENGEGPSVRSIKDQLTRLRDAAWNQADVAASAPGTPRTPRRRAQGSAGSSMPGSVTPRTPVGTKPPRTPASPFSSFAKRGRADDGAEEDGEWVPSTPTPRSKARRRLGQASPAVRPRSADLARDGRDGQDGQDGQDDGEGTAAAGADASRQAVCLIE
ncbi:hypothetical protein KEM52_002651, partial [Ascosphaera acerosa]